MKREKSVLVKVGAEVEIARVRTSGCPESCLGPQVVEVESLQWWGSTWRLDPCKHTIDWE